MRYQVYTKECSNELLQGCALCIDCAGCSCDKCSGGEILATLRCFWTPTEDSRWKGKLTRIADLLL
jgi:hypothetical protein